MRSGSRSAGLGSVMAPRPQLSAQCHEPATAPGIGSAPPLAQWEYQLQPAPCGGFPSLTQDLDPSGRTGAPSSPSARRLPPQAAGSDSPVGTKSPPLKNVVGVLGRVA